MRAAARSISAAVLEGGQGGTHAARYERDVRVEATERRLAALRDAEGGLVFGRIDREDGERLYIGVMSVADEDNEPLVVDWRAPAAEPFYRATPGEPMGVVRRRHFLVDGRRLVGIEDDLLAGTDGAPQSGGHANGDGLVLVGEAALLASLRRARTGRMGDIVATIQREQDEVIRSPLRGVLVVQGGPGTGKTAVALHRAAYLLYTHRFPLERAGVLLLGPNRVFLRYIEQVLPALGEHTVAFATPGTVLPAVEGANTESPATARVKGDARMADVISAAVTQRQRAVPRPMTIPLGRHALTLRPRDTRRIVERFKRRRGTHNERRPAFERALTDMLIEQWWRLESPGPDHNLIDGDVRQDMAEQLHRTREYATAVERMWPLLTPTALLNDLFGVRPLLRLATEGVLRPDEWKALERPRRSRLAEVDWSEDDVALLDEADMHLGAIPARRRRRSGDDDLGADAAAMVERTMADVGAVDPFMRADLREHLNRWARVADGDSPVDHGSRTFGHVLVDEAQELSPMQARMVGRRVPSASMTLVGDIGQGSGDHAVSRWDDLVAHLPHHQGSRVAELSVNYRTPIEVMELAAQVLAAAAPGLVPPRSVRSSGEAPAVTHAAGTTIESLIEATVTATRSELQLVAGGRLAVLAPHALVDKLRQSLGAPESGARALEQPLAVYPVEAAKGLEFDGVVVVEPSAIVDERPNGMRALYVAVTRTTRRLHIVHALPLPEPLGRGNV
jgi:DNA helicase IV